MPSSKKVAVKREPKAKKTTDATIKTVIKKKVELKDLVKKGVVKHSASTGKLSLSVVGTDGKVLGNVSLSEEIFGQKINKRLLAQAVRVYLANKRQGTVSTKTRGEVDGSTRKIYAQKGTGRARHGSIRAPIFVKGGLVFGPKPKDWSMTMPQKMKRSALFNALSAKFQDESIIIIDGLEKLTPKTKHYVSVFQTLGLRNKKTVKTLIIAPTDIENLKRGTQNIQGIRVVSTSRLNAHIVLDTKKVLIMKEALDVIDSYFLRSSKEN